MTMTIETTASPSFSSSVAPLAQTPSEKDAVVATASQAMASVAPAADRQAAAAELEKLKADPKFREGLLRGSIEHKEKWAALLKAAITPAAADNPALTDAIEGLQRGGIDLASEAGKDLAGILAGKPISIAVRRAAEAKWALLRGDREFGRRYLDGDPEAKRVMKTLAVLKSANVEA